VTEQKLAEPPLARSRHRRLLRWIVLGLVALFVLVQFVPVERANPPVVSEVAASAEVRAILKRSCYDCHSHETRWPWYSRVAPVSWWVVSHIDEARGDLNFSEWPSLDFELQELAFRDIEQQIVKGEMPLWSYTLVHRDARLSEAERAALLRWARSQLGHE
jgi:hypothetical protein